MAVAFATQDIEGRLSQWVAPGLIPLRAPMKIEERRWYAKCWGNGASRILSPGIAVLYAHRCFLHCCHRSIAVRTVHRGHLPCEPSTHAQIDMLPTSAERPSARSFVEGRALDLTMSCSVSAQAPWPAAWAVERVAPGASPEDFSALVPVLDGHDTLEVEPMLNAAAAYVAEKKSYIYMERCDELHSASPGTERSSYRPCEIFLDFPTAIPLGYTEMRRSWIHGRYPSCGPADCGQGTPRYACALRQLGVGRARSSDFWVMATTERAADIARATIPGAVVSHLGNDPTDADRNARFF
jgi:hypothetical protein